MDYTTYKVSPKIDSFQLSSIQLLLFEKKGGSFSSQKNSVPLLKGEKSAKALGVTEVERKKHQGGRSLLLNAFTLPYAPADLAQMNHLGTSRWMEQKNTVEKNTRRAPTIYKWSYNP